MSVPPARRPEDRRWMARALELAQRGEGLVSPNPLVGAVLVRGGRLVGEGWHRRLGGAHGEVEALAAAGSKARGATLYVTLEPCNHHGRTPPCVARILGSGVRRVVMAMRDPNESVPGKGLEALRAAGLETELGVLEEEARQVNESFVLHMEQQRPLVWWKAAATLDGRIATRSGESRWITGPQARREGHRLRAWADAILIGSGTALADDPRLTVRAARPARRLLRVVLDGRLRLAPRARLLGQGGAGTLVYTLASPRSARAAKLAAAGAELVRVAAGSTGRIDLHEVLRDLARRGVGRLLLEGGGAVAASFLGARRIDRFTLFLAPRLLGAEAIPVLGALGIERLEQAPEPRIDGMARCGPDLRIDGRFSARAGRAVPRVPSREL